MNQLKSVISEFNPWTNAYGFFRSLLATATLLTLIFNDTSILLSYTANDTGCPHVKIPSAFCLFDSWGVSLEIVRYLMIILLFIIISGWRPRFTGIIHWYICYSLQTSAITIDGGEQIATVLSFILIFITILDGRKNHFEQLSINPQSLTLKYMTWLCFGFIKFQVFIIYLNASVERLKNKEWADGTAIYYFFSDPIFGIANYQRVFMDPILESSLVIILTWSVTIFEFFLAASILGNRQVKRIALILGILFHIGIMFFIGIVTFGIVMISALLFYLYPVTESVDFQLLQKRLNKSKRKITIIDSKNVEAKNIS
ncbi:sporulation-delaying protein SdpB family protein [Bacillus sp. REN10]|uniref:sporulation-delaying protein SdpB family protein n=1 Tax=Bacillus sp. REN10 TaxID=2782541 RepID=UPI00193C53A2|nr:sporulation-delaying protein SdpB family protein [Bacillus sp. REN10]